MKREDNDRCVRKKSNNYKIRKIDILMNVV